MIDTPDRVRLGGGHPAGRKRKAPEVDRPRCQHCRNPIKDHQPATGAAEGDRAYHEDCWRLAQQEPAGPDDPSQEDYEHRIASEGLTALLSPYVSVFPNQRVDVEQPVNP